MQQQIPSPQKAAAGGLIAAEILSNYGRQLEHCTVSHTLDFLDTVANTPVLKTLVAGGAAGAVSRTCTAPVDRLKVLVQEGLTVAAASATATNANAAAPPQQRSFNYLRPRFLDSHQPQQQFASQATPVKPKKVSDLQRAKAIATHVYHTDGVLAFWRGNGVNCLKAGPEQAIMFTAREFFVNRLTADRSKPTLAENFVTGAMAGTSAQLVLYPMEVVKTRMAVSRKGEYRSIADCIFQSYRRGGLKDLYKGCVANTVGIVPHRGLDMGTYFTLEAFMKQQSYFAAGPVNSSGAVMLPLWATLGCGMVSSVISQTLTYPLNLIRTKLQTQGVNGRPIRYHGMSHCFKSVLMEEGMRGLFAGILPNMMKAVPSTAISYAVFRKSGEMLDSFKH